MDLRIATPVCHRFQEETGIPSRAGTPKRSSHAHDVRYGQIGYGKLTSRSIIPLKPKDGLNGAPSICWGDTDAEGLDTIAEIPYMKIGMQE
jgi:hypothetical protein